MNRSELSWKLADYQAAGVEAPARCISNPDLTEGEMMTADEVEEFIKDSMATLRILADKQSDRYEAVLDNYQADLVYLAQVGTLDEDDLEALLDEGNLHF